METQTNTAIPEQNNVATNPFDEPDSTQHGKIPFVTDGLIIDLSLVVKKEPKTFDWKDGNSTTRTLITFKDQTQLVIPLSLGWKISALRKEYGDKCQRVKVKIEGVGQLKKYDAMLVL